MRTVPFREVLHGVAYKMGLDPDQSNFLTNQAIPIGTYIDQWVRRTYDVKDWPEWVVTHQFGPNANHIVAWDSIAVDLNIPDVNGTPLQLGRILKVFLIDPRTTDAPVDTPFTLKDEGIHVGYEHGTYVWIKFMAPPPRYTAVQWRADTMFQKDDVTYSYTTGQVYKSKSNGNIGHNPASTFSQPPIPQDIDPPPPSPAPDITTTQPWVPDNVGVAGRNQILKLYVRDAFTGILPADPPENATDFVVQVYDVATDTLLASVLHTANGTETLNDVIDDLVSQLIADPDLSTFTITADHTDKAITLEDGSLFITPASSYTVLSEGGPTHLMKAVVTQTYIAPMATAAGQPQITHIAMTDESTVPGSVYTMTVTGTDSVKHSVSYTSQTYDTGAQILIGLIMAAEASADTFWETAQFVLDASAITLDISIRQNFSVDVQAPPPGSSWWELVPFPRAIADQVIAGALGDLLNEWGQWDKGAMVQQGVPAEAEISANDFATTPNPPLTTQQKPMSRYQLQ